MATSDREAARQQMIKDNAEADNEMREKITAAQKDRDAGMESAKKSYEASELKAKRDRADQHYEADKSTEVPVDIGRRALFKATIKPMFSFPDETISVASMYVVLKPRTLTGADFSKIYAEKEKEEAEED